MTKIAHILGGWSVNIGNAFFQLGGYHVLSDLVGRQSITITPEQPGYPSYWNRKGGNQRNALDYVNHLKPDYLVLMGPVFRREMAGIWEQSLEKLLSHGTKLILLGVGAMTYTKTDISLYRSFLAQHRPYLMVTRDSATFSQLGDLAENACDGIDFSFFLSDYYPLHTPPEKQAYLALNFDQLPEPGIYLDEEPGRVDYNFEFAGSRWGLRFPRFRRWLAERSRYAMFLEGVLFAGSSWQKVGPYDLVRLDHRPHPLIRRKTYRSPNTMVNDTPYPYLNLYGNAALTLTDRVHAAAVALQYGKAAMLFTNSPRVNMLQRLGLEDILHHPVYLGIDRLTEEKDKIRQFLRQHLGGI